MEEIDSVIFDLGGVLVDLDAERCIAAFRHLGMPQIAELINPYHPAAMIGQMEHGEITFHEACERMRTVSGRHDVSDEEIADAYGQFLVGIKPAKVRLIETLRQHGLKTYVLSNNNPSSMELIRRMFAEAGCTMERLFDRVYLSYELRELKPSEAIFRKMVADSGMVPERTLFIDDSERNVTAARALGFQVYMPAPDEDFGHLFDGLLR